jgi:adenylosuccinate lyase
MLANIHLPASLGQAICERVMIAMYRKTGLKHEAHSLLSELSRQSREAQRPIIEILEAVPDLRDQFSDREWDELFHLEKYTGTSALQVDRILQHLAS